MLIGPYTVVPFHQHAAFEVYRMLAGNARWKQGEEDWVTKIPGDHLYHESMIMHGVQTTEEPLLAMFIWWGDVTPAQWCTKCIKCTE